jgi:hypothetical protein
MTQTAEKRQGRITLQHSAGVYVGYNVYGSVTATVFCAQKPS